MLRSLGLIACLVASPVTAQDKMFSLQVPDALTDTGFIKHLLPRFSLKTGVRITPTKGPGDAAFGDTGVPVFKLGEVVWHFAKTDGPYTDAFEAWLLSDIGKRTIEAFAPDGDMIFSADVSPKATVQIAVISGDAKLGETVSLKKCGRCHVINDSNRMKAIGSTPSFALMRTFSDWQQRFEAFFTLKPHPAFTQVAGVTEPFAQNLPSPIAPIEVTLDQIEAITAYVATIAPADLGAQIQSQ
jgi:hypothetical protein